MHGTLLQIHPVSLFMITGKRTVDDQSVNINEKHFEGKPPNVMTVNFSCYMVV